MRQLTENIWGGNVNEAEDSLALDRAGVRAVLSLTHQITPDVRWPRVCAQAPFPDNGNADPRNLAAAVVMLTTLVYHYNTVFVHCMYGRSRTALVIRLYLAVHTGCDPRHALPPAEGPAAEKPIWRVADRVDLDTLREVCK